MNIKHMPLIKAKKLRSKKKRLRKKHPSGFIFAGPGFRPILVFSPDPLDITRYSTEFNPYVKSFDSNGFTISYRPSVIRT